MQLQRQEPAVEHLLINAFAFDLEKTDVNLKFFRGKRFMGRGDTGI